MSVFGTPETVTILLSTEALSHESAPELLEMLTELAPPLRRKRMGAIGLDSHIS